MGPCPPLRKHRGGHTSCAHCHFCELKDGNGCHLAWLHNDGVARCESGGNLFDCHEEGVVEWLPVCIRAHNHVWEETTIGTVICATTPKGTLCT